MNVNLILSNILGSILLGLAKARSNENESNPSISANSDESNGDGVNPLIPGSETKYPGIVSEVKRIQALCSDTLANLQLYITASEEGRISLDGDELDTIKYFCNQLTELVKMWGNLSGLLEQKEISLKEIKSIVINIISLETEVIKHAGTFNVKRYLTEEFLQHIDEYITNHRGNLDYLISKIVNSSIREPLFIISPQDTGNDAKE
ncbi:hypothetical protein EROM_051620 [Encephalitozoon romaleae SJ-2008]|uniref:Secreted protein n=1 Tax=Encephalitozoon romaleae (strain SJ-2008) TaxID=1178016 RepID=I7ART4_ENCRO|nr:hypothetical protein EROM_051620 [Encephalitozoon romaleae SJ-2008]AFN83092.1 hypothetical protein EROM_051620 [Encephalitozoon romaleae SJ-2008]